MDFKANLDEMIIDAFKMREGDIPKERLIQTPEELKRLIEYRVNKSKENTQGYIVGNN